MFFCRPLSTSKRFSVSRKIDDTFSFTLFEKADNVDSAQWTSICGPDHVFFNLRFLALIEHGTHAHLQCRYAIIYHRHQPCGIMYFQVTDFNAGVFGDLLNHEVNDLTKTRRNLFRRYIQANRHEVLMRLFTCGNNLVSGQYGMMNNDLVDEETFNCLALEITRVVSKEEKLRGTISAVLLKDFRQPLTPLKSMVEEKFQPFNVEPNMLVEIPQGVSGLNEYISLFSKKYRNRAKKILEASSSLRHIHLDYEGIKTHEKEIYSLYEQLFEKAKFKLIKLPLNYFSEMKKIFGQRFILRISRLEEKIVSFYSCILMEDDTLEAHYVGLNYEKNPEFDLYQNILYALIQEALRHQLSRVNLGRTAAEIKSTVGARPEELICYIRPQNLISGMMQKPFIQFLQPGQWIRRNPFSEEKQTAPEIQFGKK